MTTAFARRRGARAGWRAKNAARRLAGEGAEAPASPGTHTDVSGVSFDSPPRRAATSRDSRYWKLWSAGAVLAAGDAGEPAWKAERLGAAGEPTPLGAPPSFYSGGVMGPGECEAMKSRGRNKMKATPLTTPKNSRENTKQAYTDRRVSKIRYLSHKLDDLAWRINTRISNALNFDLNGLPIPAENFQMMNTHIEINIYINTKTQYIFQYLT